MNLNREKKGIMDKSTFLKDLENKNFMYQSDIKDTLKFYKLPINGKKKELVDRLKCYFTGLDKYKEDTQTIIKLQRKFRELYCSQGPGFKNKELCINDEDFLTFESKDEIDDIYFFSFKEGNSVFFFDIRSFKKLVDNKGENPYTRTKLSDNAISKMHKRLNELKHNKKFKPFESDKLTEEQKTKLDIVRIFQLLDGLEITAGGINHEPFIDFGFEELRKLYIELEDIWNYRANLTHTKQKEIVPDKKMFIYSPAYIKTIHNSMSNYKKLQKLILMEIEKLITSSESVEHRKTGGYYTLIALVEASPIYAVYFPWLVQSI